MAFVIRTFRLNDDEVTRLHAPLIGFALLDLVAESAKTGSYTEDMLLAVGISHALLKETSSTFFSVSSTSDIPSDLEHAGIIIADQFYSAQDNKSARVPATGFAGRLITNGLAVLTCLVSTCIIAESPNIDMIISTFQILAYLADLPPKDQPISMNWNPQEWLLVSMKGMSQGEMTHSGFDLMDAGVRCLLALVHSPLYPIFSLDKRSVLSPLINKVCRLLLVVDRNTENYLQLLLFLQPTCVPFHIQTVSLIWALQDLSRHKHVEASICQQLTSSKGPTQQAAYEAFGNLWRFTEDSQLPGVRLATAMHIVLETLRSDNLSIRRVGEGWMRCSLKSYLRYV